MYQDYQRKAAAFSYVFCRYGAPLSVSIGGRTERVNAELVSGNYFQALGVRAAVGRVFTPELDDREYKGHPYVVLNYPYWVTRFAADPSVVGRKMLVNDYPMTIVGVSAEGFVELDPANGTGVLFGLAPALAMVPILAGGEWDSNMSVEGHVAHDGEDMQVFMNGISPGYFDTMGVRLVEGRDFDARDQSLGAGGNDGSSIKVAIVNREFATHFFGNRSALGRHIGFGGKPGTKLPIEIVGVTDNSLYEGPRDGVHRQVFVPFLEADFPASVAFYVRTSVDSKTMFAAVRREVAKLDPAMPVYAMKTVDNQLDETLGTERLIAMLSAAFGALATLLAAMGIYGVMAFVVSRRTKEIGLRMALGAQRGEEVWMVVKEALLPLAADLAIGIPAAYWASRYVASQLFGVKPTDGATLGVAVTILGACALGASLIPARKASVIDPMTALRYE